MTDTILTTKEAAAWLRIHPATLYRQARDGKIPSFRMGSDYRFSVRQLEEWTREQTVRRGRWDSVPEGKTDLGLNSSDVSVTHEAQVGSSPAPVTDEPIVEQPRKKSAVKW